ncbi:hypothetical protein U1Q18_008391 [Sarracenia purpurea var. burkii]
MVGDEGLRTVECLRGRLLAERVASRVAKEDAAQMGCKLIELENQLRVEIKSRNKAEKRLRFLVKKLESMNISHVSEISSLFEKIYDVSSSVSSSTAASSDTQEPEREEDGEEDEEEEEKPRAQIITNPAKCGIEDSSSQISTSSSTDKSQI